MAVPGSLTYNQPGTVKRNFSVGTGNSPEALTTETVDKEQLGTNGYSISTTGSPKAIKISPVGYLITFCVNDGTETTACLATDADGKLSLPAPTREGYTFAGWFTSDNVEVTTNTVFTANTLLYAHWTGNHTHSYTWAYDENSHWQECACSVSTSPELHTVVSSVTKPATALENGIRTYSCSICRAVLYTETIPAAGYDIPVYPIKPTTPAKPAEPEKDGWIEENGVWYYYSNDAAETGWQRINGTWYYLDPRNGAMAEGGMQEIDGKTYYFYDWGGMASNFWYKADNGGWYYFDGSGAMATNKWVLCKGRWYFVGSDGVMLANQWILWNGKWYYLGSDGMMLTNTVTPDGYYVNADGVWVK